MALPNETLVFCGHEYSIKNLEFAHTLEPENETIASKLDLMRQMRENGHFTVGRWTYRGSFWNQYARATRLSES